MRFLWDQKNFIIRSIKHVNKLKEYGIKILNYFFKIICFNRILKKLGFKIIIKYLRYFGYRLNLINFEII